MNEKEEMLHKLDEKIKIIRKITNAKISDDAGNEDFNLGTDDEIESEDSVYYFHLKKKGELDAPQLIEIVFDEKNEMFIGRKAINMIQSGFLFDSSFVRMSRIHAKVTRIGTKLYITDLDSKCGTLVNGKQIPPNTPWLITDGTELIFGERQYVYELKSYINENEINKLSTPHRTEADFSENDEMYVAALKHCQSIYDTDLLDKLCIEIDIKEAKKKGLVKYGILISRFYKCVSVYKPILDVILYKELDLKYYDDLFVNDPLEFICNTPENYDVYQYISNMGMKFLYIRNNLFVERLSIDQINNFVSDYDKSNISKESVEIVKQTYKDIIKYYTDKPDTMNVEYGPFNPYFFAPNNSVVIGVNIDFFSDNGLSDDKWKENFFNQMSKANEILDNMRNELANKLSIPVTVIRYDKNSTIKIGNKKKINKTYTLQYIMEHEQDRFCRVFHDVSIKKWRMTLQLEEKRIWFLSVFFNDDGTFSKFSLDAEYASDSHYEFYAEDKIRELLYQEGDEDRYFHEILIRYVQNQSGSALLSLIEPFITMSFQL